MRCNTQKKAMEVQPFYSYKWAFETPDFCQCLVFILFFSSKKWTRPPKNTILPKVDQSVE